MLGLKGMESDYYKVYLCEGDTVIINMPATSEVDFDLYFYDPDRLVQARSEEPFLTAESITQLAGAVGWWFIEVRGSGGQGYYRLSVRIESWE